MAAPIPAFSANESAVPVMNTLLHCEAPTHVIPEHVSAPMTHHECTQMTEITSAPPPLPSNVATDPGASHHQRASPVSTSPHITRGRHQCLYHPTSPEDLIWCRRHQHQGTGPVWGMTHRAIPIGIYLDTAATVRVPVGRQPDPAQAPPGFTKQAHNVTR